MIKSNIIRSLSADQCEGKHRQNKKQTILLYSQSYLLLKPFPQSTPFTMLREGQPDDVRK